MKVPSPLLRYSRLVSVASPFGPQLTGSPFHVQLTPCPGSGAVAEIEREIVGDEQIEVAVAIDVEQRTAGAPPIAAGIEAGLGRDVLEASLAEIAIQHVAAEVGDEQVDAAVAVHVAGAHARRPADAVEPRGLRRVDEPSAHVAIHADPRRLPRRPRAVAAARRARAACRSASTRSTHPSSSRSIIATPQPLVSMMKRLRADVAVGDGMREAGLARTRRRSARATRSPGSTARHRAARAP